MNSKHHIRPGLALLVSCAALAWALPSIADEAKPAPHAGHEAVKPTTTRAAEPAKAREGAKPEEAGEARAMPTKAEMARDGKPVEGDKPAGDAAPGSQGMPENETAKAKRLAAIERYRAAMQKMEAANDLESAEKDPAAHRKARREALKALRDAQAEIHAAHADAAEKFKKRKPEEIKALHEKVEKREEELSKDRKERAEKRRAELRGELGEKPVHPAVREELRSHAWRVARLQQLIFLAEADGRTDAVERAKKLLEKEQTSHKERMEKLLANPAIKNYTPPAPSEEAKSDDASEKAEDADEKAADAAEKGAEE